MTSGLRFPVEDRPGFLVPAWSRSDGLGAVPLCLAPWRGAGPELAPLIVDVADVGAGDVFVDLGSGDGSVVLDVVRRTGCTGVGVEAAADLVAVAVDSAGRLECGRAVFLHELIGSRGLVGATVVLCWLLPPAAPVVQALVLDALPAGGLRELIVVGALAAELSLGSAELVGRVRSVAARPDVGAGSAFGRSGSGAAAGLPAVGSGDRHDVFRIRFGG